MSLDKATQKALDLFADSATREWLRLMHEEKRLCTTRCAKCREQAWPPRPFCPFCQHETVDWVGIGHGATLYAFSQQARSIRFGMPQVIGLVDLPDIGRIVSHIDAPLDELEIGQALEVDFVEIEEGLTVHQFRPAKGKR